MKKKKLIFLMFIAILLTGCEVKYNISLDEGVISEEIIIPYDKIYDETYQRDYYFDVVNDGKYTSEIKEISGVKKFVLKNKKSAVENLATNDLYEFCFDKIDVLLEEDVYYIGTSSEFKCMTYDYMEVDSIELNIKTFNKVIQSNADEKTINKYTWTINKNNYKDKNIVFVVSKDEYVWYYKYKTLFFALIGIGVIVLVTFIIIKYFSKRSERANKI